MKVGIIGLTQSGKTSLYNALTRSQVELNRFGGTEVSIGVIPVPDERFTHAVSVCEPKKVSPATVEFTEGGARIERADRQGQGDKFGSDFFSAVRNMDALVLVVRAFECEDVAPPPNGVNAMAEAQRICEELLLADLTVVETRLEKLEKARLQKRQSNAEAAEHMVLERIKSHMELNQPVRSLPLTDDEQRSIRSYAFVSGKPLMIAANVGEDQVDQDQPESIVPLVKYGNDLGIPVIAVCAKVEAEVAQMAPEEEREFLQAMGISEAARDRLIRTAYDALGVMSFFTVGPDEVRAWTIPKGSNAVTAAGAIHSDLARGFIRAEVMAFDDFRASNGCWDEAKANGKMRLEGKEYPVKDGDILHVRFKV